MIRLIVIALLVVTVGVVAQEPVAAPPAMTATERADFAAVRALEQLTATALMETREYARLQRAKHEVARRQQALDAKLLTLPEAKAYSTAKQRLEGSLKARGLVVNWRTGAVSQPAAATGRD